MISSLIDIPVLAPRICDDAVARLESCRDRWIRRQRGFHTVGVAAYLDVCQGTPEMADEHYYRRLPSWNEFLEAEFGDVLESVRAAIERTFDGEARFEASVALPGFHVFEIGGITTRDQPSSHFDHQHRKLRWPFRLKEERLLSFTLALRLPRAGGALDVWDVSEAEVFRLLRLGRYVSLEGLSVTRQVHRHEYSVGTMVVQTVPLLHRIAKVDAVCDDDQRITLQGHAVLDPEGRWVLYW